MSQSKANSPEQCATLVDLLRMRAEQRPEVTAYRFLSTGDIDGDIEQWTYAELDHRVRSTAALLQQAGAQQERALLLYPPGLEFVSAFLACSAAGVVAVPTYPPDPMRIERTLPRLQAIARDSRARYVLTTAAIQEMGQELLPQAPELAAAQWIVTDQPTEALSSVWRPPDITPDTLAFLQYTSGSTGQPKGVMISQRNVLHNQKLIAQGFGHYGDPEVHVVGWLPLFHDMGLIGNVLQPLFLGNTCTLMSPIDFLMRPMRWLEAVSHFRGTTSGGPNFAYDLCARKAKPHEIERLDLRSWAVAFNGAEPIRKETLDRFTETFQPAGFRREAFYPCYGLAEATLLVTGVERGTPPLCKTVSADGLERNTLVDASGDGDAGVILVGCGQGSAEQTLAIVPPGTRRACPDGTVGEIWVSGDSVARGYWDRPELSEQTFGATLEDGDGRTFLRTGDLGCVVDGQLFVTGRLKDLIILRGRNHYPQDIELTLERSHRAVRAGCCAAFSITVGGEERLAVAAEVDLRGDGVTTDALVEAIRRAVAEHHGVHAHAVVLLQAKSIPKTSSGKIQRHACRNGFLAGTLETVSQSVMEGEEGTDSEVDAAGLGDALRAADADGRRQLLEQLVRRLVAGVLRMDASRVELSAAPAGLGLDSLMGLDLQTHLETALGLELPEAFLWQQRTLAGLAEGLLSLWEARSAGAGSDARAAPLVPGSLEGLLPLASGQQRLWFLDQLDPGTPLYTVHFGLRMKGALDVAVLGRSLDALTARHAVLRTVFPNAGEGPRQQVLPHVAIALERDDLRAVPEGEREQALRALATRFASAPFDLATGPLLRACLVSMGEDAHVLVLAQHHIITDGWSITQLGTELAALYGAFVAGTALPPAPRLQFADYARWESSGAPRLDEARAFWKERLSGLRRLELPADRARTARRTYQGGRLALELPRDVRDRLVALGREEGCTLFVTLASAYAVLLHRYSGQDDFCIGSVIANRGSAERRELLGFLANTVPLRCDVSGEPTFRALLRRMREGVAGALLHGELPFSEMVQVAGGPRDGDDNPLFQASFVLENHRVQELTPAGMRWGSVAWSPDGSVEGTAKFDLSLVMAETPEGLTGTLEYSSDRFDVETVRRLAVHLRTLLDGIAADPERHLGALPLLTPEERRRILVEWNDTAVDVPLESCFPQLFEQQVRKTPDAVAVVHEDERVTYRELNRRANRLAAHLRSGGVGPDDVVALLLERGVGLLTSILAVFKAGGAYLPLDPHHPAQRHLQVLGQGGVNRVISTRGLSAVLEGAAGLDLFHVEDLDALPARDEDLPALSRPGHLAYVIYTSGSTGLPKGAMVEHRGMLNHLYAKLRDLELGPSDAIAQTASQCFDISVWQFLSALLVGGRVHVYPEEVAGDPRRLFERVGEEGITILEVVPSLLRAALEDLSARGLQTFQVPRLRWLLLTGEALPPGLARAWLERQPACPVLNAYGPTECSDDVAHHPIRVPGATGEAYTPIGRPILNTRLYVLDRWMHPVPPGVVGELFVGGICVGRGYLNDPVRTSQSFLADPFDAGPAARLYRTGDLARFTPNGELVFLGRVDHQVKVRGFRIELGEIEVALEALPAVREAVVVAREDTAGNKRLVAYVVAREEVPVAALRQALAQRLPEYMVPSVFMLLEAMPLTSNGKVDRKALPTLRLDREALGEGYTAPRTAVEELLAGVWAEVLGLE
ncbi:amino acid adenylation domain-containing protein, partial [Corallococcus sp. CA053C]|uniref:non-ribosomal peptide synthetase n=1 Tax=Corallococcus sp. CA053C TaxID=2316732 RepID=UPI000EA39A57